MNLKAWGLAEKLPSMAIFQLGVFALQKLQGILCCPPSVAGRNRI
jgi:hypothetical protein